MNENKNLDDELKEIKSQIKPDILQTILDCHKSGLKGDNTINLVFMKIGQLLTSEQKELIINKFILDAMYQVSMQITSEEDKS